MQVLEHIRQIRKIKGFSQEYVAAQLDVDYSTYSRLERGTYALTFDRLERLAKVFNMDVCDIIHYPHRWGPVVAGPEPRSRRAMVEIDTHLSDTDVSRVASRVVELLKAEGLVVRGE